MDQEASTPKAATCGIEHCLLGAKCKTEKKLAWAGVQGRHTIERVELMALVVLAETIEPSGLYVVRVDAQHLLTSMGRAERAKRGVNGDLSSRFIEIRVTRLSRSHLAAKELDIECSTRFEMRGDIIEANLAAKARVPSNAHTSPQENEATKKE